MEPQQNGKTALITGASSGIGRELTRLFAKDGYNLILVGRSTDRLDQLASSFYNQYGTETKIVTKDLADPNAPAEIYAETQGQQIDVLVNDAGFGEYGMFATETDLQKELSVVQVNAVALMHLTKLYLKDMVARNSGKILMLGSEVSVIPNPLMAVYGATKAFIKSFSEAIRNELNDTEVTVTVLMPGATNTDFFNKAGAAHTKGADPSKTANPADVAKEGYEALMSGKDHVVAGWMNKARVAAAHIMPDPLLAANVRKDMAPKDETADKEQQQLTLAISLGVAAIALAGLYWLNRSRSNAWTDAYDQGRKQYKAGSKAIKSNTTSVADAAKDVYKQAKSVIEDALA